MKFAYADPPYYGCCRLYNHHHPDGLCWDDPATHRKLIDRLTDEYPDGWALSCHTPSLATLLPMCPDDVRIGAWVKPFHVYKKGVRPAYAWEPLLYRGGRNAKHPPPEKGGIATTPKDFIACTLRKGLTGAKPEAVCRWILDLLNYQPGDELDDLYPGTASMGAVLRLAAAPAPAAGTGDGTEAVVSWCRLLRSGPPCPYLCADCKCTDALLTPEQRLRLTNGVHDD